MTAPSATAGFVGIATGPDLDWLEQMADRKEALEDKIDRLFWCLNLHLNDGFDRAELAKLEAEVAQFAAKCRGSIR